MREEQNLTVWEGKEYAEIQKENPMYDHASRIRDVFLVRRIFSSWNPRGSGIWDGEGMGREWKWGDQFTSNLGPRWAGSHHTKEGFQVSKREWKGNKGESERGSKKARGLCHNCVVNLYTCT
jgi:hypothetical protein